MVKHGRCLCPFKPKRKSTQRLGTGAYLPVRQRSCPQLSEKIKR